MKDKKCNLTKLVQQYNIRKPLIHSNLSYPVSEKVSEIITQVRESSRKNEFKRSALSLSPKRTNEKQGSYLLPATSRNKDMKTLVLDLDETLVHSTFDHVENYDLVIPIEIEGSCFNIYVSVRPGAFEFIEELSDYYEIVIFTASLSKYAEPLITALDTNKRCNHRLFREHCTYIDGVYVKDLAKLGRNLKNVVIVDNSPLCYNLQENNGIPIKSWFDDKTDRELFMLLPILRNLAEFYDVRTEIPKFVCNNTLLFKKAFKWVEDFYAITTNKIPSNTNKEEGQNFLKNKKTDLSEEMNNLNNITNSYEESHDPLSRLDETFIIKSSNFIKEYSKNSQMNELNASENSFEYVEDHDILGLDEANETQDEEAIKNLSPQNININIFNGNFNNIVLNTETNLNNLNNLGKKDLILNPRGGSRLEEMTFSPQEASYRVVQTEDNLNCKSPTQNIIAGLKNVSSIMNNKFTQRKGLFYLKKKNNNNTNIKIIEDSSKENSKEMTKLDLMNTLKSREINLKGSINRNFKKVDIYNIKTNYSSFLKGNNAQRSHIANKSNKSNKSNASASYMVNSLLEKNNFTYDNLVLKTQESKTRNYKTDKINMSSNKYNKSDGHNNKTISKEKSLNKSLVVNLPGKSPVTKSFGSLTRTKTKEQNFNFSKEKNNLDEMKRIYTNKLMESFKKRSTLMSFVNKNLIQTEKKNDILIKANPSIPKVNVNSFLKSRIVTSKNASNYYVSSNKANSNKNKNQFSKFTELLNEKNKEKNSIKWKN